MARPVSYPEKMNLRVLFVTTAFPRWKDDGRGTFIYEMAKAISNVGCSVKVIAMHSPGAKEYEEIDGIEVFRPRYLPDRWEVLRKESAGIPFAWKNNPLSRVAIVPFLLTHLFGVLRYKKEIDIVHAHWTLSAAVVMLSQFLISKPYVVTVHGSDVFQAMKNPLYRFISKIALTKAKFVIAPTRALAEEIINLGIDPLRVRIISNGVSLTEHKNSKRQPMILFVGSLIKLKGVYDLIQAFLMISSKNKDIQLMFIGEGAEKEELRKIAVGGNIEKRVVFLGPRPHNEVIDWMSKAKILVLPSYQEGQGVVLLEAMSVGTPCIGSNVGGIPEVINENNGWLFEVGNIIQLKEILLEAINNEDLWKKKSNYCFDFVRKYSWDNIAKDLIDIYRLGVQ